MRCDTAVRSPPLSFQPARRRATPTARRRCSGTRAGWRALAAVINLLDPDVIVLGGGLSAMAHFYTEVPALWSHWVFSAGSTDPVRTALCPALHGDATGVIGAAWLGRPG